MFRRLRQHVRTPHYEKDVGHILVLSKKRINRLVVVTGVKHVGCSIVNRQEPLHTIGIRVCDNEQILPRIRFLVLQGNKPVIGMELLGIATGESIGTYIGRLAVLPMHKRVHRSLSPVNNDR